MTERTVYSRDDQAPQHQFGLRPAKIGATFAHRLRTVEIPLDPPMYASTTRQVGEKARTRVSSQKPTYRYGKNPHDGSAFPEAALPGATIMLDMQDLSRVEASDRKHAKWVCNHPDCKGQSWDSKDALFVGHASERELTERGKADRDERKPSRAHVYYAEIEIAGRPEKKDKDGKTLESATPPTVMLASDEY